MNIYREAGKVIGFYDIPMWKPNIDPKPVAAELFKWVYTGEASNSMDGPMYSYCYGYLIEDKFDTIEKKVAYLQGIFERWGLKDNKVCFANSLPTVERCVKWLRDIAHHRFHEICAKQHAETGSGLVSGELWKDAVISVKSEYYIPICTVIEIVPEIVEYVKQFPTKLI